MTTTKIKTKTKRPATAEAGTVRLKAELRHVFDVAKTRFSAQPVSLLHTVLASEGAAEDFATRIVAVFSSPAEAEHYAELLTAEAAADTGAYTWEHPTDAGYRNTAVCRDNATVYSVGELMLSELAYDDAYAANLARLHKCIKALR